MVVNQYIGVVTILRSSLIEASRPRYRAIAGVLSGAILEGRIQAGAKLPPLRILADELSVTVGTVSRAYSELDRLGLVSARVGDGTYVCRPGERPRGADFEIAPKGGDTIDLSRNTSVPGRQTALLAEALERLARDRGRLATINEYSPDAGLPRHREAGADWLRLSGVDAQADDVVVTNGAQHALVCTMMSILRSNDLVVSEHLSYPGLVAAARMLGIRLAGLPIDDEGLIPDALRDACEHQKVHALYCTPTIQNPTTAVMSAQRRQRIAQICEHYNVRIIEDDAHGVMVDDHPLSLAEYAPAHSVTISSMSKAVSAGLRVGFISAPRQLVGRIAGAVRASCWMATPLAAEVAAGWIFTGTAAQLRNEQRKEIGRRKALVLPYLSNLSYRTHGDCCHFWIGLPESWRASQLVLQLAEAGVSVKAAEAFAIGNIGVPQFIRASTSGVMSDEVLERGFRIVRDIIQEGAPNVID